MITRGNGVLHLILIELYQKPFAFMATNHGARHGSLLRAKASHVLGMLCDNICSVAAYRSQK